jgi:flagellar biosynthesis protein FlhG
VSGKGGVGKTNLALNLGIALARLGRRVVLVDGDLALGKIDLLLGAEPRYHLGHVLAGTCDPMDALLLGPYGLSLLPGGCGLGDLAVLDRPRRERLDAALLTVGRHADFLLLDLATGLGPDTVERARASDRALLVTTPEPTSLADAYAVLKTLIARRAPVPSVIVNRVREAATARDIERRITDTAARHLGVVPRLLGFVPEDPAVGRAVERQTPFLLDAPQAPASRSVAWLASRLAAGDDHPDRAGDVVLEPLAPGTSRPHTLLPHVGPALRHAA